jgi:hypothetical protein
VADSAGFGLLFSATALEVLPQPAARKINPARARPTEMNESAFRINEFGKSRLYDSLKRRRHYSKPNAFIEKHYLVDLLRLASFGGCGFPQPLA